MSFYPYWGATSGLDAAIFAVSGAFEGVTELFEIPESPTMPEQAERRLQLAVLEDALRTLQGSFTRKEKAEAYRWFMSNERKDAFCFLVICECNEINYIAELRHRAAEAYAGKRLALPVREVKHTYLS
jgi:hypothetical protein